MLNLTWFNSKNLRHWTDNQDLHNYYDGDSFNPLNPDYWGDPDVANQPSGNVADIVEKAKLFIGTNYYWGGSHIGASDCSFFVNYCYGTTDVGSHGDSSVTISHKYSLYGAVGSIEPKTGMILWRPGHVGLYINGEVWEMANSRSGFQARPYSSRGKDFQAILYSKKIDYDDYE